MFGIFIAITIVVSLLPFLEFLFKNKTDCFSLVRLSWDTSTTKMSLENYSSSTALWTGCHCTSPSSESRHDYVYDVETFRTLAILILSVLVSVVTLALEGTFSSWSKRLWSLMHFSLAHFIFWLKRHWAVIHRSGYIDDLDFQLYARIGIFSLYQTTSIVWVTSSSIISKWRHYNPQTRV